MSKFSSLEEDDLFKKKRSPKHFPVECYGLRTLVCVYDSGEKNETVIVYCFALGWRWYYCILLSNHHIFPCPMFMFGSIILQVEEARILCIATLLTKKKINHFKSTQSSTDALGNWSFRWLNRWPCTLLSFSLSEQLEHNNICWVIWNNFKL